MIPIPCHGAVLDKETCTRLLQRLHSLPDGRALELYDTLAKASGANYTPEERKAAEAYMDAQPSSLKDGEVETDSFPAVSMGDDNGAYVQGWVWVSNKDAGLPDQEDEPFEPETPSV